MSSADPPDPEEATPPEAATDAPEPQGTAPEATADPEEGAAPADDARRATLDALAAELGDDLVATETAHDDVWVRVRREAWGRTAEVCRGVGFDYFCFLSAIDWAPSTSQTRGEVSATVEGEDGDGDGGDGDDAQAGPTGDAEAAAYPATTGDESAPAGSAWETGVAGGDTRFQVLARLYSTRRKMGITLKADLDDESPAVDTWTAVYRGANWHERETWEMFGIDFVGHPNLIHIYLPGEFEGFPLRKDFPLLSREVKPWPGLVDVEPMPEEAASSDGEAQSSEEESAGQAASSGGEGAAS